MTDKGVLKQLIVWAEHFAIGGGTSLQMDGDPLQGYHQRRLVAAIVYYKIYKWAMYSLYSNVTCSSSKDSIFDSWLMRLEHTLW